MIQPSRRGLTHERLLGLLSYDGTTGIFTWRIGRSSRLGQAKVGAVAGAIYSKRYRVIGIDGVRYLAHRLAWFYVHGSWPIGQIDHINMVKDDNRISNLRDVTPSFQHANVKVQERSTSGFKGVYPSKNRWRARIRKDGAIQNLGTFASREEAYTAYANAAKALFGESARV